MTSVSSDIEGDMVLPATTKTHRLDKGKLQAMAEFHGAMYINNANNSRAAATKHAGRDISAIQLAFPAVQDESIFLAMAAWLSILRNVNDEIEGLDADTAQLALIDSAAILTSSIRSISRSPQRYGGASLDPACDVIRAWTKNFFMLAGVLVREVSAMDVETIRFRPFVTLLQADLAFVSDGISDNEALQEMEWM
ncbi:hypothetical protein LTR91_025096 [Friedmanniomyces endolithicus]|uniref:Uncharacterized protein n=1 Tax=Friedmanniomyces endolithicus TaxID=329885 RepID=A0AAN6GZF0_9PEZI|nr:hypothetical protein LTS09_013501 [Friedmanniomyces endolithicus]KAK0268581.1 hypothetical protein LTR35_015468 [Friedmanniomyces endolithicus]KAK0303496.1 hypothetical protein LTR01_008051 [Friedmanniomyces endolithicus]KAK0317187.1 hypothetical protein LTR82_011788 [Friedmanniomyces endolithicus]KAK0919830.1 hypothetical protein LTR57_010268 [Friedmanniomyces endolithicus]